MEHVSDKQLVSQGDKILVRLSRTKHLLVILFGIAFLEATISPLLPEVLIALVLAYRKDVSWKVLSLVSALGSSCGAMFMYVLGKFLYINYGAAIIAFLHGESVTERARSLFEANAFSAQFFAALTPLPDRIFSFLAGAFMITPVIVFTATFVGRLIRIVPVAYLSYEYGDEARSYIKKHTRTSLIFITACIVTYCAYKLLK